MFGESVVKFKESFRKGSAVDIELIKELNVCRKILFRAGLIGQDPERYDGASFGNLSKRLEPYDLPEGKRKFVITGTQTSNIDKVTPEHYTTVTEYDGGRNLVVSEGPIHASSESLTHGTLYDIDNSLRFVFHIHSPHVKNTAQKLGIPITNEKVGYGSLELVNEVKRLFRESNAKELGIFAMGSDDGIFTFGKESEEAGLIMLKYIYRALLLK